MAITIESLLVLVIVGAVAGWLAGQLMRGSGFGLVGNIAVGIIGAFIGSWVLGALGIGLQGLLGAIIGATLGAVLLLFVIGLVKR